MINYTFSVTNNGNLTLTAVGVADVPTAPAGGIDRDLSEPHRSDRHVYGGNHHLGAGPDGHLQRSLHGHPGRHQPRLDRRPRDDPGHAPSNGTVNATSNIVTVTVTQSPSLTIVKMATPPSLTHAGDTITYTFNVTNNGNVNLTGVGVTDNPQPPAGALTTGPTCQSLTNPSASCSGATTALAPGQEATFTGTYVVTQADINHGSIVDHATAQGTPPAGGTTSATSNTVTVTATQSPSLTIAKSATPATVTAAGQPVNYTFTVVNNGNVTLTSVGVTDVRRRQRVASLRLARACRTRPTRATGAIHHLASGPGGHVHRHVRRDAG